MNMLLYINQSDVFNHCHETKKRCFVFNSRCYINRIKIMKHQPVTYVVKKLYKKINILKKSAAILLCSWQ